MGWWGYAGDTMGDTLSRKRGIRWAGRAMANSASKALLHSAFWSLPLRSPPGLSSLLPPGHPTLLYFCLEGNYFIVYLIIIL